LDRDGPAAHSYPLVSLEGPPMALKFEPIVARSSHQALPPPLPSWGRTCRSFNLKCSPTPPHGTPAPAGAGAGRRSPQAAAGLRLGRGGRLWPGPPQRVLWPLGGRGAALPNPRHDPRMGGPISMQVRILVDQRPQRVRRTADKASPCVQLTARRSAESGPNASNCG